MKAPRKWYPCWDDSRSGFTNAAWQCDTNVISVISKRYDVACPGVAGFADDILAPSQTGMFWSTFYYGEPSGVQILPFMDNILSILAELYK